MHHLHASLLLVIIFCTGGCASVQHAAIKGVKDPMTWGNLSAAALIAIADKDRVISDSLSKRTPLFNGQKKASDKSSDLRTATSIQSYVSALFVDDRNAKHPALVKLTRTVSQGLAAGAVAHLNDGLQKSFGRTRPNNEPDGFPSGHSARTFASLGFLRENYASSSLPTAFKYGLQVPAYLTAYGTAWARIEAKKHFPTDVLFGAAFGNFMSVFINELIKEKVNSIGGIHHFNVEFSSVGWQEMGLTVGFHY